jgi:ABC-2 type transport system ATP-binding protein
MDEAQVLCDRIAIMDEGQIIALDTAPGLIGRLGAQATIDCYLDGTASAAELGELAGVSKVREANERFVLQTNQMEQTLLELLHYATRLNMSLTDLQVRTPTLEDVFLDLTGRELRPEQA